MGFMVARIAADDDTLGLMDLGSLRQSPYVARASVDSPVGLVLVRAGQRANATTVSFFSEVAHHPTSMWICLERESYTHGLLAEVNEFSFITLHRGQAEIAAACGTESGRARDKCKGLPLYDNGGGFLFLQGAMASTACRVVHAHPVGAHTIFIAHILSGDMRQGRASLRNLLISDLKIL
jgi:flavin reductase (DIM6/NTAB) family NADH-FMN oxidoreductase RutF